MEKIGISFRSNLTADQVRERFVTPLRSALDRDSAGIYSNYLRQVDPDEPTEHLLVFEVHDFKEGLRLLRLELQTLGLAEELQFHNLNSSSPGY